VCGLASSVLFVAFNAASPTSLSTLSLHDALPISRRVFPERISPFTIRAFCAFFGSLAIGALALVPNRSLRAVYAFAVGGMGLIVDRKSTRLNSSHVAISYAVFCLKKKNHDKRDLT